MKLRSFKDNVHGVIDITVAISIGIVFAALMMIAYVIWTLRSQLIRPGAGVTPAGLNNSINNITSGFDRSIAFIVIAIFIAILAIALSYLLLLRHGTA